MATLNYSTWLKRLGLRRDDGPGQLHAVQPVNVVADHSALVSPILPPSAEDGVEVPGTPGFHGWMTFQALSEGGAWIDWLKFSSDASTWYNYFISPAGTAIPPLVNLPNKTGPWNMVPGHPVKSVLVVGNFAVPLNNEYPAQRGGADEVREVTDIYIPPGASFVLANQTIAIDLYISMRWHEFESAPNEPGKGVQTT